MKMNGLVRITMDITCTPYSANLNVGNYVGSLLLLALTVERSKRIKRFKQIRNRG